MKPRKKGKGKHGKRYIKVKGGGTLTIQAKTKEEAIEIARDRIEQILEETHPTFKDRTLIERWMRKEMKLLGFEEPVKGKAKEEFNLAWTNIKEKKLVKGGRVNINIKQLRLK